jgi:hypothetical protein
MGMGICCAKRSGIDRDDAPMLNPDTKMALELVGPSNRDRRPPVPLLHGLQTTFEKAAEIDSSSSPIEPGLVDELDSADSDDLPSATA